MRATHSLGITTLNKKHWAVFALLLVAVCAYGVLVAIPSEAIYRERNPLTTAATFYGLPAGNSDNLALAAELDLPILAIQDPRDPVNQARYSQELARRNPQVTLWMAPVIENDHPDVAWKERWGSHVAAFAVYPQETVAQIMRFIDSK